MATGFADGYNLAEHLSFDDSEMFKNRVAVGGTPGTIPTSPVTPPVQPMPHEIPTITPSKGRYEQLKIQMLQPAYVRNGATFAAASETQTRTMFRPAPQQKEETVESNTPDGGGSLF